MGRRAGGEESTQRLTGALPFTHACTKELISSENHPCQQMRAENNIRHVTTGYTVIVSNINKLQVMFSFRAKSNLIPYTEHRRNTFLCICFFSENVDIDIVICKCILHIFIEYYKIEDANKTDVNTAVKSLSFTFVTFLDSELCKHK